MTCAFQQCDILTSVDSDKPVSLETPNAVRSVAKANSHRIFKQLAMALIRLGAGSKLSHLGNCLQG